MLNVRFFLVKMHQLLLPNSIIIKFSFITIGITQSVNYYVRISVSDVLY